MQRRGWRNPWRCRACPWSRAAHTCVQPPATPLVPGGPGTNKEVSKQHEGGGRQSQKEMLFRRGKAMSGAPIISGTIQLPNPPMMAGMTMKNTMISPCAVTKTLNISGLPKICMPGSMSSMRMPIDSKPPTMPPIMAKIRYIVPMSLWLVENEPAPNDGRMLVVMGCFGMGAMCHGCLP